MSILLATCLALAAPEPDRTRPNIVVILADDVGYGDLSCYGATKIKTPHLDRLATQGMRFTDAHSAAAVCTPTRYALLTGQYAWRHQPARGILSGVAPLAVPLDRVTIPKLLKQANYTTGVVGKWHLGLGEKQPDYNAEIKPGAREVGFDYSFLIPATGDRTPCVYVENGRVVGLDPKDPIRVSYAMKVGTDPTGRENPDLLTNQKPSHGHDATIVNGISRIGWMTGGKAARWKDEDMADEITRKAVKFIDDSKAKPFFLYFATHDAHVPRCPHPRFRGKSEHGLRGDAIVELDWCVGEILASLDRHKLADNTLVIFTSDNGGVMDDGYIDGTGDDRSGHRCNGVLRAFKGSPYEGGSRVPCVARWPGVIPAGSVSNELICSVDLLATCAALTGQKLPAEAGPDSFDILPALKAAKPAQACRETLVMQGNANPFAVRQGSWKLLPATGMRKVELYNLTDDLSEKTNLAEKEPAKVKELAALLEELRKAGRSRATGVSPVGLLAPQRPLPVARTQPLTTGPALFVDPTTGDDRNDGAKGKPWRTLQVAVKRLKPGDTLYLRGGVYPEKVYLTRSGTAEAPIVVAAYPGELPILDGGLREFREEPAQAWQPFVGGAEGEYVSTRTYPGADDRRTPHQFLPASWEPLWGIEELRPLALGHFADSMVPLHGYRTLTDLRATNEYQPKDKKAGGAEGVYCGPGLWYNRETERIHVRLAHTRLPGLGDRAYRGETDPRKLPLIIAAGFGDDVLRINGVKHVRIEGLVLRGATGSPMIHVYGSDNVYLDHLTIYGGFPAVLINAAQNIKVTHCAFRGLAAPWTGRAHMKYRGTATYQIVLQNAQPSNENIEFAHCEFTDDHDFAFLRFAKNLTFHHNFVDNFNDDGLECGAKLRSHTLYIHHNRIGACLGVFQQHEMDRDESPADHAPDTGVYVYRNVFDQRAGVYYTLPTAADPTGAYLHSEGHLISDHGSPTYPVMHVYHNTFLRREPVFRDYFLFGLGAANLRHTERDVFNNIFVQANAIPGAVILGKDAGPLREGGNLLWGMKATAPPANHFAKLRASPLFVDSRKFHEPGWSTLDVVADPKFADFAAGDLRLQPGSPALDAGVVVPAKWPDPLREADMGKPDLGALPAGVKPWGVGVGGRIPVFGK